MPHDYLAADRLADLIMKGGVTSGVVYPPAIDQIVRRFYLHGIGGTSAGAIAASLAAAAEFRRRHGSADGYLKLAEIPGEISGEGRLLQLFRPDPSTRDLFHLGLRLKDFGGAGLWERTRLVSKLLYLFTSDSPLADFNRNGSGLCTGMAFPPPGSGELPPLTQWLSDKLDDLAGVEGPLTFGMLAKAPRPDAFQSVLTSRFSIQLQLISTCLTFGRPYALPRLDDKFHFDPAQMARLLPRHVVDYMVAQAQQSPPTKPDNVPWPTDRTLLPLPVGSKMPVILATRMSLSFPALFTLVPLWHPNENARDRRFEPVYFSDGGITSNLPIHFFDSPLPRWPTLAINLQYAQVAGEYGRPDVEPATGTWMAPTHSSGVLDLFRQFLNAQSAAGKVMGLGSAILSAARGWNDNSLLPLPGYRDRVVEVWLDPDEGGMNLNMPPCILRKLNNKGTEAGRLLVERFADHPPEHTMSWYSHRRGRYWSSMAGLAEHLHRLRDSIDHPHPGDADLWDLINDPDAVSFRMTPQQRAEFERATRSLVAAIDAWKASQICRSEKQAVFCPFCDGPAPHVTLQPRAPLSGD